MGNYLDKTVSLTPLAKRVICNKATEYPHTGAYIEPQGVGTYLCRRCGLPLFSAVQQFHSGCGWPAFDDNKKAAITEQPDADGQRQEIICSRCQGHLGHVFYGEYLTAKNRRHCVNAAALDFVSEENVQDSEEAIVAGGCFWGVDFFLKQLPGVLNVEVGYTGGHIAEPSYEQVCSGTSGHYEAARVLFDPTKTTYHDIIKRFFEIHDPSQSDGQGPDIGQQYESAIFYYNEEQRSSAHDLIVQLQQKGIQVATKFLPVQIFWPAENYHQDYYAKHHKIPYCHRPVERFK